MESGFASADVKHHWHFMGIGGVGMAALAALLKRRGMEVSGCDLAETPRTRWLASCGIPVSIGHDAKHITSDIGTLVISPAVSQHHPEVTAAREAGIPVRVRGAVLAEYFNTQEGIAVAGSHGKTTTATFITRLLALLGDDPAWAIGGETGDMPVAGFGAGPLVAEADESDGTLALYRAKTLVITSLDYDHPDHFKTPAEYVACFDTARRQARDVIISAELPRDDWPEITSLVTGTHNHRNARAAVEVALRRGWPAEAIRANLPQALAALPDRRFQEVAPNVYTDYAHHPAELKAVLEMARAKGPKRIRLLFQPHRYSRTRTFCEVFPASLATADEVVLIPVYAAFEAPMPGGDIADLYGACRRQFPNGKFLLARSAEEAWRHVLLTRQEGDLILLAGAGDIIRLLPKVQTDILAASQNHDARKGQSLAEYSFFRTGGQTYGGGKAVVVGRGSNTWFPDCASDVTIVHPDLPDGATLGIPWMVGIPGSIGGWLTMNAGAFGHSISEYVTSVTVRLADGTMRTLPPDECHFGYRTSRIPGVIVDATFNLPPEGFTEAERATYRAQRRPFPPRTCGSVFKNPTPEMPAGKLLEEAGAKNLMVGGARVWEGHANVIVAEKDATSSDILALTRLMARAVFFKTGIRLDPEIRNLSSGI